MLACIVSSVGRSRTRHSRLFDLDTLQNRELGPKTGALATPAGVEPIAADKG